MPSWSDDEGRCWFETDGVPCYQGGTTCPMHSDKSPARTKRSRRRSGDAERKGANLRVVREQGEALERERARTARLLALLRSDVMHRVLDRAAQSAQVAIRDHYPYRLIEAREAADCREELAAIDDLRALLAESDGGGR